MNKTKIYHQLGFRQNWNIASYEDDNVGDGFIFSPRDMEKNVLLNFDKHYKRISFFDPQFYEPSSNKKKLNTYDFFPNKTLETGYNTTSYCENCYKIAEDCIVFQLVNNFSHIVIPTLYFTDNFEANIEKIDIMFVRPFLEKINAINKDNKPVLLSLIVNENIVKNQIYRENLITYITSLQNIDGVYLIPSCKRTGKRIADLDFISFLLQFIYYLKYNELEVHIGYSDIEGLLLTLANVDSLSIGSYENLRNFDINKFIETEGSPRAPRARLFSSKLLQWIDFGYLGAIERRVKDINKIFDDSPYNITMFNPTYNWNFQKPELYKHYFLSFSNLIKSLPDDYDKRYEFIFNSICRAEMIYDKLNKTIPFDNKSDGTHLSFWKGAIMEYNSFINS